MTEIDELPWCKHGINKTGKCAECKVDSLMTTVETLQHEKTELMNDLQRVHERTEEALADQPDNYASFLAITDINGLTSKRLNPLWQDGKWFCHACCKIIPPEHLNLHQYGGCTPELKTANEVKKLCTHLDVDGRETVIIDGDIEQCTQCGAIGK